MAVTYVGVTKQSGAQNAAGKVIPIHASAAAGDLMLVSSSQTGSTRIPLMGDAAGQGSWQIERAGVNFLAHAVLWHRLTAADITAGNIPYTIPGGDSQTTAMVAAFYRGVSDVRRVVTARVSSTTANAALSPATVTAPDAGYYVLCAGLNEEGSTQGTFSGGMTLLDKTASWATAAIAHKTVTAGQTGVTGTWTRGNSTQGQSVIGLLLVPDDTPATDAQAHLVGTSGTTVASGNANYSVPLPAGIVVGDLLMALAVGWGTSALTAGWTELSRAVDSQANLLLSWKRATAGDVTAGAVSMNMNSGTQGAFTVLALRNVGDPTLQANSAFTAAADSVLTYWVGNVGVDAAQALTLLSNGFMSPTTALRGESSVNSRTRVGVMAAYSGVATPAPSWMRPVTGSGAAALTAAFALSVPATGPTVKWYDGATEQTATVEGWWDGDSIEPVTVEGWWDGDSIEPLS